MNPLIDVNELQKRVERLIDVDVTYLSLLETVKLLCDEIDVYIEENNDMLNRVAQLESGIPSWMK